MKLKKITIAGLFMILSGVASAQYSSINPAIPVNSIVGKNQVQLEDFIYKNKHKFKNSNYLGFDDVRLKIQKANDFSDVSVSFLTTSGLKTICNINISIHDDGRIFSMPSKQFQSHITFNENEISQLNLLKLQSLLYGCGLDEQANPIGDSNQEKEFSKINEYYKNGQVFSKEITFNGKKIQALYPSLYLLYRNNYSDLLAMSQAVKNSEISNFKSLFAKYQTSNKLLAAYYREKQGIPQWESFNGFDLANKDNLFSKLNTLEDKELENKIKSLSHEAVMGTYLLGQREQTESIMDVGTLKQTALVYTVQMLGKNFDVRTTETIFNKYQSTSNNMAMRIAKEAIFFVKNVNPVQSGYNSKLNPTNPQNFKAISNFINNYIEKNQLDKISEIEYENMKTLYPESNIDIGLSDVNSLGFLEPQEKRNRVYQNIFNEHAKY